VIKCSDSHMATGRVRGRLSIVTTGLLAFFKSVAAVAVKNVLSPLY